MNICGGFDLICLLLGSKVFVYLFLFLGRKVDIGYCWKEYV